MVSALAVAGLAVLVVIQTALAAVLTRFFRIRLSTRWGSLVYAVVLVPLALLVTTMVLSGLLGLGPDLGGPTAVVFLMIGVPLAIGLTIDYLWMPAPEEVELPDTTR
ncbi:MAG: hypothetical protein SVG88_06835 [Halobacteriales archaeon]|nr:hypothetical protein [Halobacteriales archaeon]